MKEASGEANMTVITILLIAIVGAVGTIVINNMMNKTKTSTCCEANGGTWHGGKCYSDATADAAGKMTYSGEFNPKCDD